MAACTNYQGPAEGAQASPDEQDHPDSAPTSEQIEDDVSMGSGEDSDVGDERSSVDKTAAEDRVGENEDEEAPRRKGGNSGQVLEVEDVDVSSGSEDEVDSGRQGQESGSSTSSSSSSGSSTEDEPPRFLVAPGNDAEDNRASSFSTDCYSSTGVGEVNIAITKDPAYDWISSRILDDASVFQADECDLSDVGKKFEGHSGRVWRVEGPSPEEHVALWPQEFKWSMYHLTVSDMHIRVPYTFLQQTVLARLEIAPSQLHPNAWAFLRAFELLCIHLERPASVDLFLHLFEINRNTGEDKKSEHVSLRSRRKCKFLAAFKDSLGEKWRKEWYWIEPVNDKAIDCVGELGPAGDTVVSTKFPLGWSYAHYNRSPKSYAVRKDRLTEEDRLTKQILLKVYKQVPWTSHKLRGIPTPRIVKCQKRSEVQAVLGTDVVAILDTSLFLLQFM